LKSLLYKRILSGWKKLQTHETLTELEFTDFLSQKVILIASWERTYDEVNSGQFILVIHRSIKRAAIAQI